ncbi:uncharacterized protein LOC117176434 [Belonocnema kinseyi]|uniref:uncharacterized protein LOC117176434 n=1 Tax=Belonocnema kinseyi TaxID=2817044 RepID=UPI00143D04E3|nr:uncharacterized protein LOC117176434 [Belonocnema kinseyi]
MTIPRLELQAAVMGSRLANFISSEHSISSGRKFMWTDSQTVLRWIRSDARKYQTFVAHRTGEILESTAQNKWRRVPTNENVADEAARETYPLEIKSTNRWFTGPEFLLRDESEWPQVSLSEQQQEETLDLKREFCGTVSQKVNFDVLINFSRFSKWHRLIRTWAWTKFTAKKWRNWQRSQDCKDIADMTLTVPEVQQAELEILKMTGR